MPVNALYTGSLSYLENRFFESLKRETAALSGRAVVLCGSQLLAAYLRRRAVREGARLFNVRFQTFDSLAADLLPLDFQGRKLISPLGELLLLSKITRQNTGYFQPVAPKPGFMAALFASIRDLTDAGIPSIPASARSSAKLRDLARIHESFTRELEPYISRPRALRLASDQLQRFESVFQTSQLRVYGFYDFTYLQESFLKSAAEHLGLEVFVPFRPGEAGQFARNALDVFVRLGPELRHDEPGSSQLSGPASDLERLQTVWSGPAVNPSGPSVPADGDASARTAPTSRHRRARSVARDSQPSLFELGGSPNPESPPAPRQRDGSLRLFSAPDETAELLQVCRQIQRAARDGMDFAEMAVLLRNPDTYVPLINEIFPAAGIPYYLQSRIPLAQTHAARSLLLLMDLFQSDLPRSQVMEFASFAPLQWRVLLNEGGVDFKQFSVSAGAWNRLSAEAGITRGIDNWRRRLGALAEEIGSSLEDDNATTRTSPGFRRFQLFQVQAMLEFVSVLDRWKQRFEGCRDWRAFTALTAGAMDVFFSQRELDSSIPAAGAPASGATWRQLYGLVDSIATLDQVQRRAAYADRVAALRLALENETLSLGHFQDGCVSILGVMASRGTRHGLVFIPGMVEKGFPTQVRQDPILLDRERKTIAAAAEGNLKEKLARSDEERLLFDLCLQAARGKLVLSFPRVDLSTGRSRLPSHYLLRVVQRLAGSAVEYATLEGPPHVERIPLDRLGPLNPDDAVTDSEFALASIEKHHVPRSLYTSRLQRSLEAYKARWSGVFTQWDGCITAPDLREFLNSWPGEHSLAPSRLETLASCPYKFFLGNMLRLRAIEEPEEIAQISAMDRGSLIHEILEDFMVKARDQGRLAWDGVQIEPLHGLMESTAGDAFRRAEEKGLTGYPLLWQMDSEAILADLHRFVQNEFSSAPQYLPDQFEVNFGTGSVPPLELKLATGEEVRVKGRIDRLDVNRDRSGIRVVDYKTGRVYRPNPQALFDAGRKLQLPLYLLAGAMIYDLSSLQQSMAEYYYASSAGGFEVRQMSGSRCEEQLDELKSILQILTGAIRAGRFPAVPLAGKSRNCTICEFRLVCDRNIDRVAAFKAGSQDLLFLRQLEDYP